MAAKSLGNSEYLKVKRDIFEVIKNQFLSQILHLPFYPYQLPLGEATLRPRFYSVLCFREVLLELLVINFHVCVYFFIIFVYH